MTESSHAILASPPFDALTRLGDNDYSSSNWFTGTPDYVKEYGFTREHIPSLIEIVRIWATEYIDEAEDDDARFAPVYAWRILGQLRAVEVVEPMLEMLELLEELQDDYALNEFPEVCGLIGEGAIASLAAFLQDHNRIEANRITVIEALQKVAEFHPECRAAALQYVVQELSRFDPEQPNLNGFIIAMMMDLDAKECAELIERAYAADCVEPSICGRWGDVRREMGVEGLGLAPDVTLQDFPSPQMLHYRALLDGFRSHLPKTNNERNQAKRRRKNQKRKGRK